MIVWRSFSAVNARSRRVSVRALLGRLSSFQHTTSMNSEITELLIPAADIELEADWDLLKTAAESLGLEARRDNVSGDAQIRTHVQHQNTEQSLRGNEDQRANMVSSHSEQYWVRYQLTKVKERQVPQLQFHMDRLDDVLLDSIRNACTELGLELKMSSDGATLTALLPRRKSVDLAVAAVEGLLRGETHQVELSKRRFTDAAIAAAVSLARSQPDVDITTTASSTRLVRRKNSSGSSSSDPCSTADVMAVAQRIAQCGGQHIFSAKHATHANKIIIHDAANKWNLIVDDVIGSGGGVRMRRRQDTSTKKDT